MEPLFSGFTVEKTTVAHELHLYTSPSPPPTHTHKTPLQPDTLLTCAKQPSGSTSSETRLLNDDRTHFSPGFTVEKTTAAHELHLMLCFWSLQKTLKSPKDEKVSNFKYTASFVKRLHELIVDGYVAR